MQKSTFIIQKGLPENAEYPRPVRIGGISEDSASAL